MILTADWTDDATGVSVYPKQKDEPDTNRLAVADTTKEHTSLTARKLARITNITTADFDEITPNISASDTDNWNQPDITYNAVYPYNHVFESESGTLKNMTTQRTTLEYTRGTTLVQAYEITNNGDKIDIITNDHYTY